MYFNWLIGQEKMKSKYITASISSKYQWILDARAKHPSSYLFFIKQSSIKEAINFPRWKQLRKAQAIVCAVETGAFPLANHMLPDASNPPKAFSQLLAQGLFPNVGHPCCSSNQPTHCSSSMGRANPSPLHNCTHYRNKTQLLLRRAHHTTDVPLCHGTGKRRCLYVPISYCRTLALSSVMDGLLVTPKVDGPLWHNQGPLKKLHMENKTEGKQGLGHVVKSYTSPTDVPQSASVGCCAGDIFVLRHIDYCMSSGYLVLSWCSEKSVMPLTESNMANANTRQRLTWITTSKALPNFSFRKVRGWGTVFPLWMKANGAFLKFHVRQPHNHFRLTFSVDCRRFSLSNQQRLSVQSSSLSLGFCTFCVCKAQVFVIISWNDNPPEAALGLHGRQHFPTPVISSKVFHKIWVFSTCLLAIYANLVYK